MVEPPQKIGSLRRVSIVSDRTPAAIVRLMERLRAEVPALVVSSIMRVAGDEAGEADAPRGSRADAILLRFLHACPRPIAQANFDEVALSDVCEKADIRLFMTRNPNTAEINAFLKLKGAEVIVVYGGLEPNELKEICESQAAVLAAAATFQPSNAQTIDLHVICHQPAMRPWIAARQSLAIEPYDTAISLRLKMDLIARDLLIQAAAALASGRAPNDMPVAAEGDPSQALPRRIHHQQLKSFPVWRQREVWKLLLRTLVLGPFICLRNWYRRITGRFPIVILYHHLVSDRPHRMGIPTEEFLRHIRFLKRYYSITSLAKAVDALRSGRVTRPTVVLTFDDGYRDNFTCLRAVTDEERIPATLFVCTEHLRSLKEFAHDVNRGELGFPPMDWEQVKTLQRCGLEIGSHTRTHFDCGSTDAQALRVEIAGSKEDLQREITGTIDFFAFPWGNPQNMSGPAINLAQETYRCILSAFGGANLPALGADFSHLKRRCHANDLWELELTLQGALEFERSDGPAGAEQRFA
ncbi:MAG: polysaccharide deacetylase family protein [Candidatus Acidiferrales bacterium]